MMPYREPIDSGEHYTEVLPPHASLPMKTKVDPRQLGLFEAVPTPKVKPLVLSDATSVVCPQCGADVGWACGEDHASGVHVKRLRKVQPARRTRGTFGVES